MADLDRWKIVEQFTIYQIALLIEGYDPADFEDRDFNQWSSQVRSEIAPMLTALKHSIEDESLPLHKSFYDEDGRFDVYSSLVHVNQLRTWLAEKGMYRKFFSAPASKAAAVDNPFSPFYAPKLVAANAAWKAVTSDPKRLRGKSPKRALTEWLTEHAAEYDLLHKDGTPNVTGIEDVAKVANWKPAGGAPTTPRVEAQPSGGFAETEGMVRPNMGRGSFVPDLDDEIPF
jgi:hypothetical protein